MIEAQTKTCQNCKQPFTIEPEDFDFYEKIKVPPPTFCWLCRAQRRLTFRNERLLYKRKSSYSGKEIFSGYPPEAPFTVYENDVWYSDKWDALSYGRDYDFSRPFFEQFFELYKQVPLFALSVVTPSNSDYCNNATGAKNYYLVFNTSYAEDCAYGNAVNYSKDCVDNSHLTNCELCYGNLWLGNSNHVLFSEECEDCIDVWFSKGLRGCTNCFGCVGLRNKNYHIWNKPVSKDDYEAWMKNFNSGSFKVISEEQAKLNDFAVRYPVKYLRGTQNVDVSGNYIFNSKNVKKSFLVREGEDLKYCQYLQTPANKDCYDHTTWGVGNNLTYEVCQGGQGTNNIRFCLLVYPNVRDLEYCIACGSSSDLFACVGVKNKQYCIFNKQYTKEEYESLVPKIRKHMEEMPYTDNGGRVYKYGEFFPPEFSPYSYNETVAQEYFQLTRDEIEARGFVWRKGPERNYKISLEPDNMPDDIKDVEDAILSEVIGCAHGGKCNDNCTTAFQIIPQELAFYRRMRLPVPHFCPNCRFSERLGRRGLMKLWERTCNCAGATSGNRIHTNANQHPHGASPCNAKFETTYAPDRPEIVYCESCYNAEVA